MMKNTRENSLQIPSVLAPELMGIDVRRKLRKQLDATHALREAMKRALEGELNFKAEFGNDAAIPDPYISEETEQNTVLEPGKILGMAEQIAKVKLILPNGVEIYFIQVNKYEQSSEQVYRMAELNLEERERLLKKEGGYKMVPYGGSINPTSDSIRRWYNLAKEFPSGSVLNVGVSSIDPNPRIAFRGEPTTVSCTYGDLEKVLEALRSNAIKVLDEGKLRSSTATLSEQERVSFRIEDQQFSGN